MPPAYQQAASDQPIKSRAAALFNFDRFPDFSPIDFALKEDGPSAGGELRPVKVGGSLSSLDQAARPGIVPTYLIR
jgi:hypothetical protein